WNQFGMLYYFAGFNGYLLLGHYLRNHDWSLSKITIVGLPMFVVGFLVTFIGFRHITALPEYSDEMLELFFTYNSLNVVMMTLPLFMWIMKVRVQSPFIQQSLANLTKCGFAVYMIHYFFTGPAVLLVRAMGIPVSLQILVAGVIAFTVSWAIVAGVYKLLGAKTKYIMG
ncbi:MAG: acyltransferase, partial [Bacteroidales bacterium]